MTSGTEDSRVELDARCRIDATEPLEDTLRKRIVGQDHAVETLVCSYARLLAGLHDPTRPLLTALLLGPTGVGKTETARSLAYALFDDETALSRVNCEEYNRGHELSKLIGAPPGYVGQDVTPILSQERIDRPHRKARNRAVGQQEGELEGEPGTDLNGQREGVLADRMFGAREDRFESIILFDEIEKAHPELWNSLLGILEDGTLTLGNNEETDFSRAIILLTSNVGSREMTELLEGRSLGFPTSGETGGSPAGEKVERTARRAAEEAFPFEFLNRLDETLVYRPLEREDLGAILDKFLDQLHERTVRQGDVPVLLSLDDGARDWLIEQGSDLRYGARPLRRAVERHLVDPLSRLIASEQVEKGDVLEVEVGEDGLTFYRGPRDRDRIVA